jgi:hypothetical protein
MQQRLRWIYSYCLCFLLFLSPALAQENKKTVPSPKSETISLVTYYPSPYGAYDRMQLVARDSQPCECTQKFMGLLYVDKTGSLKICTYLEDKYQWVSVGFWQINNGRLFPENFDALYVGIGTNEPQARLHISGDSRFDGDIFLKQGPNLGKLKVIYTSGGYYATYAPDP